MMRDFLIDPSIWVIGPIYASLAVVTYNNFPSFVLGLIVWTAWEYVFHRWVFHGIFAAHHRLHHINSEKYISLPVPISAFGLCALAPAFPSHLAGICVGYLAYEIAHRIPTRWHSVHHKCPKIFYGVTSPLWDFILGSVSTR